MDATAEDITDSIPFLWRDTKTPELPQKGEKDHSWIIIDKHILIQHPKDYWAENQLSNTVPIVFGKIISISAFQSGFRISIPDFTSGFHFRNPLLDFTSGIHFWISLPDFSSLT